MKIIDYYCTYCLKEGKTHFYAKDFGKGSFKYGIHICLEHDKLRKSATTKIKKQCKYCKELLDIGPISANRFSHNDSICDYHLNYIKEKENIITDIETIANCLAKKIPLLIETREGWKEYKSTNTLPKTDDNGKTISRFKINQKPIKLSIPPELYLKLKEYAKTQGKYLDYFREDY